MSARIDNVIAEMAAVWVDGGCGEHLLIGCLHQLQQAVHDEIARRTEAERKRVELNEQRLKWGADLQARAAACWVMPNPKPTDV